MANVDEQLAADDWARPVKQTPEELKALGNRMLGGATDMTAPPRVVIEKIDGGWRVEPEGVEPLSVPTLLRMLAGKYERTLGVE